MLPDKPQYASKGDTYGYRIIVCLIVCIIFLYVSITHYIIVSSYDSNGPLSNENINHGHTLESIWNEGLPPQYVNKVVENALGEVQIVASILGSVEKTSQSTQESSDSKDSTSTRRRKINGNRVKVDSKIYKNKLRSGGFS